MATKKILRKVVKNGVEYEIEGQKVFIITEDKVTVTQDATKGVAPYSTSYGYTNIDINANAGIKWVEGAIYSFVVDTEMVVASAYRNVRVRIGNGAYIPMKNRANSILAGSSYMTKGRTQFFVYKTVYESGGALHLNVDTSYSAMSVAEGKAGTATTSRVLRADYLKQIIEYYIEQKAPTIGDGTITLEDEEGNELGSFGVNDTGDTTITIPSGGGGGSVDKQAVDTQIDLKLKDYDSIFRVDTDLYKILNDIDTEDELGLSSGSDWETICNTEASMNKISHSYAVMVMVASSDEALDKVVESQTALDEIIECWNSIFVICNSEKARNRFFNDNNIVDMIYDSQVAIDYIFSNIDVLKELFSITANVNAFVADTTLFESVIIDGDLSSETLRYLFSINGIATAIYNNNDYLNSIASDIKKLNALMSSSVWSNIMNDYTKANIFFSNANSKYIVLNGTDSATLCGDNPLRCIISNNLLDDFLAKDDRAFNGIVVFDINNKSTSSFTVAMNGYNASSYDWKYSIDGGTWSTKSGTSKPYSWSISLARGNHTLVIKPNTYARGWCDVLGCGTSSSYWSSNYSNITFEIRNISSFSWTKVNTLNYFLYYAFYNCQSLTKVKEIRVNDNPASIGYYYMANTFQNCGYLTEIGGGNLLPTNRCSISQYAFYYCFYSCSNLVNMKASVNTRNLTSVSAYFMSYMFASCPKLTETVAVDFTNLSASSDYFLAHTYENCTQLSTVNSINMGGIKTVGTQFMYYCFYNCSNIEKLPSGFDLRGINQSMGTYFLYYTWYGCTKLRSLPSGFQLPSVYTTSYYCNLTFYNCTALSSTSPAENLYFRYSASNCFGGTQVTPVSPSSGTNVAVHRE